MEFSSNSFYYNKFLSLVQIFFQDHLYINSINFTCILIILYRNGINLNQKVIIHNLIISFSLHLFSFYYVIFIIKSLFLKQFYYYLFIVYLLF